MIDVTFNGESLIIQLSTIGTYDVELDLYSAWKEWVVTGDNSKFPIAFETTGGDDIGGGQQIAPYFFCKNDAGWRIKAPQENGEVIITGNLFPRTDANPLFSESVGFDAYIRQEVSSKAIVAEVNTAGSGISEQDKLDIAALVWSYTQ